MNIAANDSPKPATHVAFFPGIEGARIEFNAADFDAVLPGFVAKHPGNGAPKVEPLSIDVFKAAEGIPSIAAGSDEDAEEFAAPVKQPAYSTFGGALVTDEAAKARIEAQHAALITGGVKVDASEQLYATGTRMADVGYATQAQRKQEHDKALPFADVAQALTERIRAEQREDVEMTAGEFASALTVNGKIAVNGLALREQAIRGLLGGREVAGDGDAQVLPKARGVD